MIYLVLEDWYQASQPSEPVQWSARWTLRHDGLSMATRCHQSEVFQNLDYTGTNLRKVVPFPRVHGSSLPSPDDASGPEPALPLRSHRG
jgi:hypothetical protein